MGTNRAERMALIIRDHLVKFLVVESFPRAVEVGNELGRSLEERLIREMGGERLTIPSRSYAERQAKYFIIFRDFRGDNHKELAARTGYTKQQIYNILRKRQMEFDF